MSTAKEIKKATVVILLMLIVFSSGISFPVFTTKAATEVKPKPAFQTEEHQMPDLNITIKIVLDPLIELQQSFVYMEINLSFNPLQIEKVALLQVKSGEETYNSVINVSPEDDFFEITAPKFGVQIPFPTSYYYYVPIKPKSMRRFTHPEITYMFNTTVYYRNATISSYVVKSNKPVVGTVLPSSADMPVSLQNGIISTILLAIILPIGVWFVNRTRKKKIRKKRFQNSAVTAFIFILLFLSTSLFFSAVPYVNAISSNNENYLLEYSITTYYDTYNNNTFYPNASYLLYIWYEAPVNSTSVVVGVMNIGKTPLPEISYCEVNFQTREINVSLDGSQCFWFVPQDIELKNTFEFLGYNLKVDGTRGYYTFSMLREVIVLEKNDSAAYVRGYFDKESKILYQLAIQNKTEDTIEVYQLNYVFGIELSEKWDYYYEVFFAIVAVPTIIVGILTWPKSPKIAKKKGRRIKNE